VTLQAEALRKAWRTAGWLGVGLVVFLSLIPAPPEVNLGAYTDKWEHLSAYALLMWWFSQLQVAPRRRALTALWIVAMGIAIEFAQRATATRMFEISDMVTGTLGVGLGWLLATPRTPNALRWLQRRLAPAADSPGGQ
jgi:VanZ family protein